MRIFSGLMLMVCFLFGVDATLEISKKGLKLPTIQIEDVSNDISGYGLKVQTMLLGDLKVSGHFKPQIATLIENIDVDFEAYAKKGVDLVLRISTKTENQSLISEVRLFDINIRENIFAKAYSVSRFERYPFLAHRIAIDINNQIKAPPIDWMNRFVIFSKYNSTNGADIVISDYTLTFQKVIVTGGLNIFPKWANSSQESFYYTKYLDMPTLIKQNIYTGESEEILKSSGMLACSDVSQDEKKILITMAPDDQPDIYEYQIDSKKLDRVTTYRGIDVSAHYVDDDSGFVFVSDRLGNPNLFQKDRDRSGVRQLVYHGKNNSSCTTHNEYVVYSSRENSREFSSNTFNLYLVSTRSEYIRKLTASGVNQYPRFSIDGESVIFLKHLNNQSSLGIIRLNYNSTYLYPLSNGSKIQSIDW